MQKLIVITLIIILLCALHLNAQIISNDLGDFGEVEKLCIKKLEVDEFMVDYNLRQLYMPEANLKFNKYMACVWRKTGFIDAKNNLIFDAFKDFIAETYFDVVKNARVAEAFARDSVNSCKILKGDTPGQTGVMFMNCITRLSQVV